MIPTYKEALAIVEKSEAFYVSRGVFRGYEYAMFNYRMALFEDFKKYDAFELRGMTYINDNGDWDTFSYPMLNKFFNLNENISTQYSLVKDKEISSVEYKEDGSLISFIILPNGEVVPKTKMSFDNDQTAMVYKWMESHPEALATIKNKPLLMFLFELVSPKNKIVLKYGKTELRLLQIRGTITGEYKDNLLKEYSEKMKVPLAESFKYSLDELIELRETLEDIEGWVIKFSDGQMIKLKTEWYVSWHGLMSDLSQENKIIEMIIDETIDDVLSELEEGCEEKEEIHEIMRLVDKYYNHRVQKAEDLRDEYFSIYNSVRKDFAIAKSKSIDFGLVMKCIDGGDIGKMVKSRMKIENHNLMEAREFLDTLRRDEEKENL